VVVVGTDSYMRRTLTDDDIEAIATRVVTMIATRLASETRGAPPGTTPAPAATLKKLAYKKKELLAELGISGTTLWRLEILGRLTPVPGIRHKIYARTEVERFLRGEQTGWR